METSDLPVFHAVCCDCGTVKDESFDHQPCSCGGVFHVDSARCLSCGRRHPFKAVGSKCACGGEVVPKMVTCPACGQNATVDHLGEHCDVCNVQLRLEG